MSNTTRKLALLLAVAITSVAAAQSTLEWPTGEFQAYPLDSGVLQNLERGEAVVYDHTITVKDAVWMRLYFGDVELGEGSYIRMTSALDNEVQELDVYDIAMWNYSSAYFNGDTVRLELVAGPSSKANRVVLDRVAVNIVTGERGPCADDDCGMCGVDERVLSNENWSGRMMPVGCTGSIYNTDSCAVSAGHCVDGGWADVIQFNVPPSGANCSANNPPVNDQFPITGYLFNNNGVGDDWSVMTVGTNGEGLRPYDKYGLLMPIATSLASVGDSCAVWGFGVDNGNPTRSQDQQTSDGTIQHRYTGYYTHDVDITYGNSGSGLIHSSEIIGIITHCSFTCDNIATRVDKSDFTSAREQLCSTACVNFLTQPEPSQEICEGDVAILSVVVSDSYQMTFQWKKGGVDLVDDGVHIIGAQDYTLYIIGFTAADEASDYYCEVTNTVDQCSENSNNAELLLSSSSPVILQQPQDLTVTEGDPANFVVVVEDAALMTYQWRRNEANLTDDGRISGATTSVLSISPTVLADAADYDCVVTNQLGAQCSVTSDIATLTVNGSGDDCPEDLSGDGSVGLDDLGILLDGYGACAGDPNYNADADFDGSGCVDLSDLGVLLDVYGQDCPTH